MSDTIYTSPGGDMLYVDELIDALNDANEQAGRASDEADQDDPFFFIQDQDGRGVKCVKVIVDTLSDGSKAFTIQVVFGH